jgi:hypothetical protein
MFTWLERSRVLVVAMALSSILATPLAGLGHEPNLYCTPAGYPRMVHSMGSGGLGHRLEDMINPHAPFALSPGQHLMGSGGLGSKLEETVVPVVSGRC